MKQQPVAVNQNAPIDKEDNSARPEEDSESAAKTVVQTYTWYRHTHTQYTYTTCYYFTHVRANFQYRAHRPNIQYRAHTHTQSVIMNSVSSHPYSRSLSLSQSWPLQTQGLPPPHLTVLETAAGSEERTGGFWEISQVKKLQTHRRYANILINIIRVHVQSTVLVNGV